MSDLHPGYPAGGVPPLGSEYPVPQDGGRDDSFLRNPTHSRTHRQRKCVHNKLIINWFFFYVFFSIICHKTAGTYTCIKKLSFFHILSFPDGLTSPLFCLRGWGWYSWSGVPFNVPHDVFILTLTITIIHILRQI